MNSKYYTINFYYVTLPILLISVFLIIFSVGCITANSDEISKSAQKKHYNSIQLIDKSLAEGKIDRDKAYLFKVYTVFDLEKLPEEFRSDIPFKGGTMLVREIRRVFDELGADTKEKIRPYLFEKGNKR